MSEVGRGVLSGRVLEGRIELQALIGRGGMGEVYRAHHRALDKTVAVKVLSAAITLQAKNDVRRFEREARTAAQLDHPGCVRVLDSGEDHGLVYLVLEYVEGESLDAMLRRERALSVEQACALMQEILAALGAAHRLGIVHRDVKPGNILLDRGRPRVCDFGIAKLTATSPDAATHHKLTSQGAILGTPAYMAPEQAMGKDVDARTDLYAAGVVFYEMLAGRPPFIGNAAMGVLIKQMRDPPDPLSKHCRGVPRALERIVMRALEKNPASRYASAEDFARAIDQFQSGAAAAPVLATSRPIALPAPGTSPFATAGATMPPSRWVPPEAQFGRVPWIVGGLLAAIAAVVILTGVAGRKSTTASAVAAPGAGFFDKAPLGDVDALEWYLFSSFSKTTGDQGREKWREVLAARREILFPGEPVSEAKIPGRWAGEGRYYSVRLEITPAPEKGFVTATLTKMFSGGRTRTSQAELNGAIDGDIAIMREGLVGTAGPHYVALFRPNGGLTVGWIQHGSTKAFFDTPYQLARTDESWNMIGAPPSVAPDDDPLRELRMGLSRNVETGLRGYAIYFDRWTEDSRAHALIVDAMRSTPEYVNQVDQNLSLEVPSVWATGDPEASIVRLEIRPKGVIACVATMRTRHKWYREVREHDQELEGARDDHAVIFGGGVSRYFIAFRRGENLWIVDHHSTVGAGTGTTILSRVR